MGRVCNYLFDLFFAARSYVISGERVRPCKYMNLEVYFTSMNLLYHCLNLALERKCFYLFCDFICLSSF